MKNSEIRNPNVPPQSLCLKHECGYFWDEVWLEWNHAYGFPQFLISLLGP